MLLLLSPAKTLDYEAPAPTPAFSQPQHLDAAAQLIGLLRKFSPPQLASLMRLSDKLAALNVARYGSWNQPFTPENAKPAVYAFQGDVYQGLQAQTLDDAGIVFMQQRLRILSGLYGVLKPLDLMQAYRLEMGTKLANPRGDNLYDFWGEQISERLNSDLDEQGGARMIINLASQEYFKAVKIKALRAQVFTPVFKDLKDGQYKVISFLAKEARGLMSRFVIDNRIERVEDLKHFDAKGYYFSGTDSTRYEWIFKRDRR